VPGGGNAPPVAADDAYAVRIGDSLSVPAPGVLANDSDPDGNKLSAALVKPPTNGALAFNPDGSFVYTPDTIKEGELVFVEAANLGRFVPGVKVNTSSEVPQPGFGIEVCDPPDCALDDLLGTSWITASGDAANLGAHPFYEVVFPSDQTVTQLQVVGNRDGFLRITNLFILAGQFQLFDANGNVVFDSGVVALPAPEHDVTLDVPSVSGVRRVRFTSTSDQGNQVGFAELRVIGPTFLERSGLNVVVKYHALADIPGDFGGNQHGIKVISTPMVAHLTDDNGDGKIDAKDVPAIVFSTMPTDQGSGGTVMALSGADGHVLFTAGTPNLVATLSEVAVGVIDGTGLPTIIAAHSDGQHLIAFDNTGKTKWVSDAHSLPGRSDSGGAISIANLDGSPKIIVGASVYDANGKFLADGRDLGGTSGFNSFSAISAVSDVDLDGVPEIIAGPTAYRFQNGQLTKVWQRTDRSDGFVGIARFGDDPRAQIVVVGNGVIYMLNADGTDPDFWNPPTHAPVPIPGGGAGGAPTIADMDGDGIPEIGVAAANHYTVFKRDGSVLWSSPTQDVSSNATGSTVFDFNQDGTANVIYRDEQFLRIYRGKDGQILFQRRLRSGTATEQPVVADVANDGHAKIIVPSDNLFQGGFTFDDVGIYVLEDVVNKWGRTRGIWNQHSYHITNVNDDGTIPPVEQPNWLVPGLDNFRLNAFIPGASPDQADSFTYKASDGALESNEATVRITIRQPNTPPSIVSTPVTTAATNVAYLYAVHATDPDPGDVLTFSLPLAPTGMTIDPAIGLVKWTPTDAQAGAQGVTVKVQDAHGAFAVQGYTVQVGSPASVPDVVGQTQTNAQTTITGANLVLGAVNPRASATVAAGTVASQNPLAGTLVAPGSPVSIDVSTGPPAPPPPGQVPDVVGETQSDAQADIVAASFKVGTIGSQNSFEVPAGFVLSQNPAAGTLAKTGSPVSIVVSVGPAHIPNVVGETQSAAEAAIAAAGFSVGVETDQNSATVPSGAVISQDPAAGSLAAAGAAVNLALSIGAGVPGDTTPPAAGLDLAEGTIITIPTDITGSVADANFLRYTLGIARVDSDAFATIGSGSAPTSGVLGRVDPTLLENGLYRLRLVAEDKNGQATVADVVVEIEGMAKVGNFRLSFTDLTVPLAGIPISIVRTYDSRVKTNEDFGIGWTLDVKRGFYEHNRTPGEGWQILSSGGTLPLPCETVSETATHITQVRLSDYEFYTFALTLSNPIAVIGGCEATASFAFVDGRRPGATLQILDPTGVFYFNGDNEVVDEEEFLTYNPQRVRLTTADGRIFDFQRGVGITHAEDLNGNHIDITPNGIVHSSGKSVAFVRDAQNRITQITDPAGNTLAYSYDGNGDLATFVDQAANQTTFSYDTRHDLTQIVDPLGRKPIRTEYDADGRLIAVIDANGNRRTIEHDVDTQQEVMTDRLGNVTVLEYDARGNIVRKTDPLGHVTSATFDARDNKLSETDALGSTRTYTYDANDNKLSETDALGHTTHFTYNSFNQVTTRTDALGATTTSIYDGKGNPTALTDQLGNTTTYTYDGVGNPLTATDPLGNTSTYASDGAGNRTQAIDPLGNVVDFTYDANGNLITETTNRIFDGAPQTVTKSYQYDERSRLVRQTDPEAGTIVRAYTATGALASVSDPLGRTTIYGYDDEDRPVTTTYPDGTTSTIAYDLENRILSRTDRAGRTTTFAYDAAGRQISTTFADGSLVEYAFDAADRRISATDENGHVTKYVYDAAGHNVSVTDPLGKATIFSYDNADNLVSRTDRNGHATTYSYDAAHRLTGTTFADGSSIASAYDALGRRISTTDQAGNLTRFVYDALGNLVEVVDTLGSKSQYAYDALNYRIAQTDPLGNTIEIASDRLGREVSRKLPAGETQTRTYDLAGNLASLTDFNGKTTSYAYDAMNRLASRALPDGEVDTFAYFPTGRLVSMTDPHGTTAFTYDSRDRALAVLEPDGTQIRYAYDAHGNRTGVTTPGGTTTYAYDADDRLVGTADASARQTTFAYDAEGNRTAITYPDDIAAAYVYDNLDRLTKLTQTKGGSVVRSYAYTLGPTGNRTRVVESSGRQVDYTYDALFRLTQERIAPTGGGSPTTTSYTYDAFGNRLTQTNASGTVSYAYDAENRMLNAGATTFGYDANGNMTSRTAGASMTTYQYDALNRLRQVLPSSGTSASYTYDAIGSRVQRLAGGATTNFLVDRFGQGGVNSRPGVEPCCGLLPPDAPVDQPVPDSLDVPRGVKELTRVLRETDATGAALADYTIAGDLPVAQQRGINASFYLPDGQHSVRALASATGSVTDTYDYDAFGNLVAQTGTTPNAYLYDGEEFEPSASLYNLRARFYDPSLGRFTAVDPEAGDIFRPSTLHPYAYASNDPVNRRDPSGRQDSAAEAAAEASIDVNLAFRASLSVEQFLARVGTQAAARPAAAVAERLLARTALLRLRFAAGLITREAAIQELRAYAVQLMRGLFQQISRPALRCAVIKALPYAITLVQDVLGELVPSGEFATRGLSAALGATARGAGGTLEVIEVTEVDRALARQVAQGLSRVFPCP
jgi:RHS repeat-associated protein